MRLVCLSALIGLASSTRAKDMKDESFAWPWDRDSHHAVPHHLGGLSSMMAARARVHHGNMFDTGSSDFSATNDFSTDSDSGSGGDFMDQYITETGHKPLQVDDPDNKPKEEKKDADAAIPDMASLFGDDQKAQAKPQQPWAEDHSSSSSDKLDNLFGGSFGFEAPQKAAYNFDAPAKPVEKPQSDAPADDFSNLFGGSSSGSAAPVEAAASTSSDSSASGWPWDTHAQKKDETARPSRDLWSSHSDSDTNSGSSSISGDMTNLFGGSSDSGSNHAFDWSSSDFSGKPGVSQPAHAPQQDQNNVGQGSSDSPSDSPIQGPTQREGSISGASATDQVVDVRLSSELQQSLLQARSAENKMLQRFRGVAN